MSKREESTEAEQRAANRRRVQMAKVTPSKKQGGGNPGNYRKKK